MATFPPSCVAKLSNFVVVVAGALVFAEGEKRNGWRLIPVYRDIRVLLVLGARD